MHQRDALNNLPMVPGAPSGALALLAALICLCAPASGDASQWPNGVTVDQTPHNLTHPAKNQDPDMVNQIADYDEVCVYCHSPHWAANETPLWNRPTPSAAYRMPEIDAPDMIQDGSPTGNSLKCLSCHDGTLGLDDVINPPLGFAGPQWGVAIEECEDCHRGGSPAGGIDWEGVWLDTDLRTQHPFSVLYDPTQDAGFRSIAEVQAAGLVLFNGKIQCMTCHAPHSQQFRPFLRIPNSGLCLTCHRNSPSESTAHFW